MKLKIFLLIGLLNFLYADYDKGLKYYNKYIKRKTNLTSVEFLKKLDINSTKDLNETNITQKVYDTNDTKLIKGYNKILKKHKEDDLKDFLKGVLEGKIPASCN